MGSHTVNKTGKGAGLGENVLIAGMKMCQKAQEIEAIKAQVIKQKDLEAKGQYITIKAYPGAERNLYKPEKRITRSSSEKEKA